MATTGEGTAPCGVKGTGETRTRKENPPLSVFPVRDSRRITVVGSSNVDMIMRLPRLPGAGETVTEGEFSRVFGGKGANQAVAAARAGGRVSFVTAVGAEDPGPALLAAYAADGIDTEASLVAPAGVPTGTALILVDSVAGENSIAVAPGANFQLSPEHIDAHCDALLRDSTLLVLQMEIPAPTVAHVLRRAGEFDTPVLLNYAPARALGEVPLDGRVTLLVVNEHEAAALAGVPVGGVGEARAAAEVLLRDGPANVIVTLGPDGSLLVGRDGLREHVPSFPITPVDTTAAGDTFCGALAVALVEGATLPDAARFASAAGALSVTRPGAQPSIPRRAEIDTFLTEKRQGMWATSAV